MFNLSSYLEKFNDLKDPSEHKNVISAILQEEIGVTIQREVISIDKEVITIQMGSIIKNQIFLKKDLILKRIQEALPDLKIKNII